MFDLRIVTNGITLQVKDYRCDKEPLVFLHYGGGNLAMWERVVPYFIENYRLLLIDMRGHGKSDKPRNGNTIEVMASDIAGVIDYLKIDKVNIIGSSLGAETALALAANFPEKVKSLICDGALYSEFGPYGIWEGNHEDFKKNSVQRCKDALQYYGRQYKDKSEMVDASKNEFEKYGWWNEFFRKVIEYDAYLRDDGLYSGSWQNYAAEEYLEKYFNYRFEEYYSKVKCPVLMIAGEEALGNERIKKAMYGFSKLTKNCRIIEDKEWVHPYGWLIAPEQMCREIAGFLKNIR